MRLVSDLRLLKLEYLWRILSRRRSQFVIIRFALVVQIIAVIIFYCFPVSVDVFLTA